jgi:GTP cyclohydrolase I
VSDWLDGYLGPVGEALARVKALRCNVCNDARCCGLCCTEGCCDCVKAERVRAERKPVPLEPIEFTTAKSSQVHRRMPDGSIVPPIGPKPRGFDYDRVKALGRELLEAIGEDPERPDLVDTPRRWADAWREFIEYDPGKTDTVFQAAHSDGRMVVVSGMRVWSLCEHHLLPFWCDVAVGYQPHFGKVLGLSKFGRIAEKAAHRLQTQERMAADILCEVREATDAIDVGVLIRGEHLCMSMRGIRKPSLMTTVDGRGSFDVGGDLREEFLRLAGVAG